MYQHAPLPYSHPGLAHGGRLLKGPIPGQGPIDPLPLHPIFIHHLFESYFCVYAQNQLCDNAQKYIRVPLDIRSAESPVRSKEEIRKTIEAPNKEQLTEGPFTERKNIARIATRHSLKWVLGEVDNPLAY
jgi:hypothetical protein